MNDIAVKPYDKLAGWLLVMPILAVTLFVKFAIPLGGNNQIYLATILIGGAAILGFMSGRFELHKVRLILYLILMGVLTSTQLLGGYVFSVMSLLFFASTHLPYIFGLKQGYAEPGREFLFFQKIVTVVAVLGILQYFLQFLIGSDYAFFLDTKFPEQILTFNFNSLNEVDRGSGIYKSNGFFLQEPSNFSQVLALAIIMQMVFFKNYKKILLFLIALAVTFSGTGLIMLFSLAPLYLLHQKKFITLTGLIVVLLLAPVWAPAVGLEKTLNRSTEIAYAGSSGFARFVSPIISIQELVVPEGNGAIAFGLGAGSMQKSIHNKFDYEASTSTWGKMIFEYGIVGSLMYLIFMGYMFFSGGRNLYIVAALFIQFMLLGEYILPPVVHGLILALLVWPRKDEYVAPVVEKDKPREVLA